MPWSPVTAADRHEQSWYDPGGGWGRTDGPAVVSRERSAWFSKNYLIRVTVINSSNLWERMMAEPPSTETGGQQYWTDEHHRGHRLDGPATIATGNGERRMITWSCVGRPTKFILFNASSFYFAEKENKRSKTFTIKRKGVIGA